MVSMILSLNVLEVHFAPWQEDVRQLVILLHERKMKVIVDVNMMLSCMLVTNS